MQYRIKFHIEEGVLIIAGKRSATCFIVFSALFLHKSTSEKYEHNKKRTGEHGLLNI